MRDLSENEKELLRGNKEQFYPLSFLWFILPGLRDVSNAAEDAWLQEDIYLPVGLREERDTWLLSKTLLAGDWWIQKD